VKLTAVLTERLAPILAAFSPEDLELVVETVVLIAYADTKIDEAEREALRTTMETVVRSPLSPLVVKTLIGSAMDNFREAGDEAYAQRLGKAFASRNAAEHGYRVAAIIALSSQGISDRERRYLTILGEASGLAATRMEELERELVAALGAG
jgi:tellurite resistance protein